MIMCVARIILFLHAKDEHDFPFYNRMFTFPGKRPAAVMSSETGGKTAPPDNDGDGRKEKADHSVNDKSDHGRLQLTDHQLKELPADDLRTLLRKQESYISALETRNRTFEGRTINLTFRRFFMGGGINSRKLSAIFWEFIPLNLLSCCKPNLEVKCEIHAKLLHARSSSAYMLSAPVNYLHYSV